MERTARPGIILLAYLILFRPLAYCGWKTGLCAEITLNGFQLPVLDSKILYVPERLTIRRVAKVLHKSVIRASADPLQVKIFNEIDLCIPALRFESSLADVVVAGGARKGEVVGEQSIECTQVLIFPRRVPIPNEFLVRGVLPSRWAGTYSSRQARRTNQRTGSRCEQIPAGHSDPCHCSFSFSLCSFETLRPIPL
jgi:hypothetical protein